MVFTKVILQFLKAIEMDLFVNTFKIFYIAYILDALSKTVIKLLIYIVTRILL